MSKGRQRYTFTIRRGADGGYAVELDNEPRPALGGLGDLFHVSRLFVAADAKEAGDQVARLLAEGEPDKEDGETCSKDKA